jgi:hypothetical protein
MGQVLALCDKDDCFWGISADALHGALVRRADALAGCTEGLDEAAELEAIADVLDAYESKRWPDVKEPGGKG